MNCPKYGSTKATNKVKYIVSLYDQVLFAFKFYMHYIYVEQLRQQFRNNYTNN